jgi:hypothetical protein
MGRDKKKPIAKIYYNPFLDMGRKENSLQNLLTTHFCMWAEKKKSHCKIYYNPFLDMRRAKSPWKNLL